MMKYAKNLAKCDKNVEQMILREKKNNILNIKL